MTTRLKIDLSQGILEVEGSETFVKIIYNDFKAHFVESDDTTEESPLRAKSKPAKTRGKSKAQANAAPVPAPKAAETTPAHAPQTAEAVVTPSPAPAVQLLAPEPPIPAPVLPTYTFIEDLKLGAATGRPSLVEFMDAKLPITNEERNLVFLYYLQHILKIKPITLDHVYTCYRQAKIRAPLNIENSLRMTAEHRGWIKANQNGTMAVTPEGKLYVEKQLPKKVKN